MQIEQILADGKTYPAGQALHLPARTRDIEIDYTALSFRVPQKVRFRYKLEGRNVEWHEAGTRRQAVFSDLDPGPYTFHVMASNDNEVWNEAGALLDFYVAPAYYQTTWFRAACVAGFLALLVALYRGRIQYMSHEFNIRLEERLNERTRIARDFHDTLLQSFQGVLMKFAAANHTMVHDPPEAQRKFEVILGEARQAITEGRNAVQGLRSATAQNHDLAQAIGAVREELDTQLVENRPAFRLTAVGDSRDLPPLVRDEIFRIASEAIRNSFAHAQATQIDAEIHYESRQFRLLVRDNGKGIDPQILNAGGRERHHGLPGLHERAALVGGKLTVRSRLGAGTEIELTIPAARAYGKPRRGLLWRIAAKGN